MYFLETEKPKALKNTCVICTGRAQKTKQLKIRGFFLNFTIYIKTRIFFINLCMETSLVVRPWNNEDVGTKSAHAHFLV